jgi:polysaccharide pyruvyl transferase WcaK-like protein
MNKVALINLKYSHNLGDGLIADCLEEMLQRHLPDLEIVSLDLTGAEPHNSRIIEDRPPKRRARFFWMPVIVKKVVKKTVFPYFYKKMWGKYWKKQLGNVCHVVIGGGHLFQDAALYFPTCISTVLRSAPQDVNVYIYGVGVSSGWSQRGHGMMRDVLSDHRVQWVTTRDEYSRKNWERLFGHVDEVVFDPGLLCGQRYVAPDKQQCAVERKPLIALGVSDPEDLKAHCERADEVVFRTRASWLELIEKLSQYWNVMLFTNGATSDRYFLGELLADRKMDTVAPAPSLSIARSPRVPRDLVMQLYAADVVISHRLHGNIAAFALKIPHIGLYWDRKILSFFELTGRTRYVVRRDSDEASHVVELVRQALLEPIDEALHTHISHEADKAIGRLAGRIREIAQRREEQS